VLPQVVQSVFPCDESVRFALEKKQKKSVRFGFGRHGCLPGLAPVPSILRFVGAVAGKLVNLG
jgi:hypothetical protein